MEACTFILAFCILIYYIFTRSLLKLPPSPWGLPLIGHLHLVGALPHRSLQALSKQYGPIFSLRLGATRAVVISSSDLARQVLKSNDLAFADRPYLAFGEHASHNFLDIAAAPYNEHLRSMRRMCYAELFRAKRLESSLTVRMDELAQMVSWLEHSSGGSHVAIDVRRLLNAFTFNAVTRILMSKRFFQYDRSQTDTEGREFQDLVTETVTQALRFHTSEFLPSWLRWTDWTISGMKRTSAKQDMFLKRILDEHRHSHDRKDFMDVMLEELESDPKREKIIKAIIKDLITGGADTSACVVEWTLLQLIRNPSVMEKARDELDKVVGNKFPVEDTDIPKLEYLQAVVKESFRLHLPIPLLLPHKSREDCKLAGYDIPKGTTTIINAYAIGRNHAHGWEHPTEFLPERFLGKDVDLKGLNYELLPFGSGRRACPGMMMGLQTVQLLLSNLIHGFNWRFVPGRDYALEEIGGTVTWLKTPLVLDASPRRHDGHM